MFRILLNSFTCNKICSKSINLNMRILLFLFVCLFICKLVANDHSRYCRISLCNFVYEIQFLTACFLSSQKKPQEQRMVVLLYSASLCSDLPYFLVSLSFFLLSFLITLITCHMLQIWSVISEKWRNQKYFCVEYFRWFYFLYIFFSVLFGVYKN